MIRPRHFVPLLFTLVVAHLYAGSLSRLQLLFILLARPAITVAIAGLLLFVIVRSSDICSMLQIDLSAMWIRCFVAASRRVLCWRTQPDTILPQAPSPTPLFQRPPPAFVQ
jgi:hypothetical protein